MANHPNRSKRMARRVTLELSRSDFNDLVAGLTRLKLSAMVSGGPKRVGHLDRFAKRVEEAWAQGDELLPE